MDIVKIVTDIISAIAGDQPLDITVTVTVPVEGKNYNITVRVKEV